MRSGIIQIYIVINNKTKIEQVPSMSIADKLVSIFSRSFLSLDIKVPTSLQTEN